METGTPDAVAAHPLRAATASSMYRGHARDERPSPGSPAGPPPLDHCTWSFMLRDPLDTVSRTLDAIVLEPDFFGHTVTALLSYQASDPYAVSAVFADHDGAVHWVFARDLLADGLHRPTGEGDVRVRPSARDKGLVEVRLSPPHATSCLGLPAAGIAEFVRASHALVPPGREAECLELDTALTRLLTP
jgi:hypothetical protein